MDGPLLGVVLADQFRVEERIATGGMGDVYRAEDLRHGRPVAVKVLRRDEASGATDERFQREVEIASQLSHPHLLPLYQSGRHEDAYYFVMPYVEDETLGETLRDGPRPTLEQALRIGVEVADALAYAHEKGVVHRDVKPANIFISDNHAVLADFGVAKSSQPQIATDITQTGASVGTPLYMSPEQALEGTSDARSDIYSLGCILYEMLTGEVPHRGATVVATFVNRQNRPAPSVRDVRPDVSDQLEDLLRHMLEPVPDARIESGVTLQSRLQACLDEVRLGRPERGARERFWRRGAMASVAVVAAVMILRPWASSDPIRTVAVLPLEEIGADVDGYLAQGVGQELRNQLSRIDGLTVASWESSVAAARSQSAARSVAETLDVEGVVQGTIRRDEGSLSISVRLTDARSDRQEWGATVTGAPADIFELQDEILDSLRLALGFADEAGERDPRIARTTDVATHNLYLQGRYAAADRTREALERARTMFEMAIDRDPAYAPAWAALASTHALTGVYEYRSWLDLRPEAERAVDEAIRLDDALAEAYAARGLLLDYAFRWDEAEAAYVQAIDLNASYAQAHHWYAVNRVLAGRPDQATALIERARELDPLSFAIAVAAGWVYYYQRDLETAVERLEGALDIEPNAWVAYQYLGLAYTDLGRYADGIAALERARELNPSARSLLPGLARAHALGGDGEQARSLLEEARLAGAPMYWLAIGYLAVGDTDEALSWLERARDAGPWNVIEINTFWYEGLKHDPRFSELVADVHPV